MVRGGLRTLHLAGTERDFLEACRQAEPRENGTEPNEWILSLRGPSRDLLLPANVEWIRLPGTFSQNEDRQPVLDAWSGFLESLAEAFAPDVVVVHRGFARLWETGLTQVLSTLPPAVRVECSIGSAPPISGSVRRFGS